MQSNSRGKEFKIRGIRKNILCLLNKVIILKNFQKSNTFCNQQVIGQ